MPLPQPASPLNAFPTLRTRRHPPSELLLCDVTLREGEQSRGVSFSLEQKVELALALEAAGVRQIQVGYPGRFERDLDATRAVSSALTRAATEVVALAFVPDWEAEISACLASEAAVVNVVHRASDRLHGLLGVNHADVLHRVKGAIRQASSGGATVAFTPSDGTRADQDFLLRMWEVAAEAGADRLYVADSVGVATPELVASLVERARSVGEIPIGVHCHNDFGMVVANTCAGVMAGAELADVAVNGLGDRAGNAPLEEVATALALLYELDSGIDLVELTGLSERVATLAGRTLPTNKPVTGSDVFAHTLPTHVAAIEADARAIQPFEPELVGNRQRIDARPDETAP